MGGKGVRMKLRERVLVGEETRGMGIKYQNPVYRQKTLRSGSHFMSINSVLQSQKYRMWPLEVCLKPFKVEHAVPENSSDGKLTLVVLWPSLS